MLDMLAVFDRQQWLQSVLGLLPLLRIGISADCRKVGGHVFERLHYLRRQVSEVITVLLQAVSIVCPPCILFSTINYHELSMRCQS